MAGIQQIIFILFFGWDLMLRFFTPDIMEAFIDKAKDFNLEIINNNFLVYYDRVILSRKQLYAFYDFARFLIEKLGTTIKGMKSSLEAMRRMEGGGKD